MCSQKLHLPHWSTKTCHRYPLGARLAVFSQNSMTTVAQDVLQEEKPLCNVCARGTIFGDFWGGSQKKDWRDVGSRYATSGRHLASLSCPSVLYLDIQSSFIFACLRSAAFLCSCCVSALLLFVCSCRQSRVSTAQLSAWFLPFWFSQPPLIFYGAFSQSIVLSRYNSSAFWTSVKRTIVHHIMVIQQSIDTIHLCKVKAQAGILENECADAIAKCSAENWSGHDIHITKFYKKCLM